MKKKLIYLVMSFSMMFSLAAPVAVHAMGTAFMQAENKVTSNSDDSTTPTTTTSTDNKGKSTTTTKSDDSTTTTTEDSGRSSRLETYKKELKETLTTEVKTRIATRCVAAQGVVKGKTTSNDAITTARETTYDKIISDLQGVVSAASAQDVDITALQSNISELQAKIVSFKTANTTYQQALSDLGQMDCKTDPTAFKAALEAARTDQLAVFNAAKTIRSYLNDTVKVTLNALKAKLKS